MLTLTLCVLAFIAWLAATDDDARATNRGRK